MRIWELCTRCDQTCLESRALLPVGLVKDPNRKLNGLLGPESKSSFNIQSHRVEEEPSQRCRTAMDRAGAAGLRWFWRRRLLHRSVQQLIICYSCSVVRHLAAVLGRRPSCLTFVAILRLLRLVSKLLLLLLLPCLSPLRKDHLCRFAVTIWRTDGCCTLTQVISKPRSAANCTTDTPFIHHTLCNVHSGFGTCMTM